MNENKRVLEYYDQCHIDYKLIWKIHKTHAIHYGFYDKKNRTHKKAVANMNRVLARLAKIKSDDKVLDCGCGVGGSSVWIAKEIGAKVTGVNINKMQIEIAKEFAKEQEVGNKVTFLEKDFTKKMFPKNSFDVLWGIESICYVKDKRKFLKKAAKLLKKRGRIIIADGFIKKEAKKEQERKEMQTWLEGWAVPNIATISKFKKDLKEAGFKNIQYRDIKENVLLSSRRMYLASLNYPLAKMLELLKIRTKTQTGNVISAYYQYKTLKKDLWTYGIFTAEKP